jgi:hypothetical protein
MVSGFFTDLCATTLLFHEIHQDPPQITQITQIKNSNRMLRPQERISLQVDEAYVSGRVRRIQSALSAFICGELFYSTSSICVICVHLRIALLFHEIHQDHPQITQITQIKNNNPMLRP